MANQDSTLLPTPTDLNTDDLQATYDVLGLRASIRAATMLLESIEGYGNRSETGEGLCDVGFILHDADVRLYEIYKKVDVLELGCARVKSIDAAEDGAGAQDGARAGMQALRNIERLAERAKSRISEDDSLSMDEWWQIQDDAVGAMHSEVGKQNPFVCGFLAVVAEYVMCAQDGGIPDLCTWKPEATMTASEKTLSRARFAEEVAASSLA